jgi:outer membrane protein TolC
MATSRLLAALLCAAPLVASAEAPLTLDEALALAARQNHDLVISKADAELAGADALGAWQGVLPRLDLTAGAGHQYSGATGAFTSYYGGVAVHQPATAASNQEAYSLNLTLNQPVVDLAAYRKLSQARASERAADRTYAEARLGVAFDVIRRFYELVKAERSLAVLEKAAQRSQELVERSDALFQAGRAQKVDTFSTRVNLGNDRIAVEQARTRRVQARADLATALGHPGDRDIQVQAPAELEAPRAPSGEPPPMEALLTLARQRRPSVAAAAAQVEAAEAGVAAAGAGYLPTLSAQATYGRQGPAASGAFGVFDDLGRAYSTQIGLVLSWNVFAGRSTEAALQRARLGADKTQATAARTLDAVASEITTARQTVVALTRQVTLSADNLGAAEQGLALARQRLEAGLASQLEVRDATLKLTQAELSLVQARIDHAVATADLGRAVGGAL